MVREASVDDAVWRQVLDEQRLPALIVGRDRRIRSANADFRARFTGGENPAGRYCFEVMHGSPPACERGAGSSCPLERPTPSDQPLVHRHRASHGPAFERVTSRRLSSDDAAPLLLVCEPFPPSASDLFLIGDSAALLGLLRNLARIAALPDAAVLRGESGSGRLSAGKLVHDLSDRRAGPFVALDCSDGQGSMLERDLLAPTAGSGRSGVSAARGGTLLLLEPERLAPSLQHRIGSLLRRPERPFSDCRWLFALEQAASSPRGTLGAAIAHAPSIVVPPLRDRLEDLPELLGRLVARFGGASARRVDRAVVELLERHRFPGNLRELECLVERACLEARGGRLRPEHFPSLASES